jgi:SEC-C motif-containing protein
MRSRYSAFAVRDSAYLLRTWHPSTRPGHLVPDPEQHWTRLEVLATTGGGLFDTAGTVEFRAHYRRRGYTDVLHERSTFARYEREWAYVGPVP